MPPFAARGVPIVGLEPSCLLTLRDELLSLRSDNDAKSVSRARLAVRGVSGSRGRGRPPEAAARRHAGARRWCTATVIKNHSARSSRSKRCCASFPGSTSRPSNSSCCGMAGAFGYGAETYRGVDARWPSCRCCRRCAGADSTTLIVADGTSCRHQIKDGTNRAALHVARVLAMSLDRATTNSHPSPVT